MSGNYPDSPDTGTNTTQRRPALTRTPGTCRLAENSRGSALGARAPLIYPHRNSYGTCPELSRSLYDQALSLTVVTRPWPPSPFALLKDTVISDCGFTLTRSCATILNNPTFRS
jgi:hypothetical protein